MTIRTRLALQFAAILAVTLMVFSLVIYYFTYQSRQEFFTANLLARTRVVAHVYLDGTNRTNAASRASYRRYLRQFYRTLPEEEARVYDSKNRVVFQEGQIQPESAPLGLLKAVRESRAPVVVEKNFRQTIGVLYHDAERGDFIVVASSLDADSQQKLSSLRRILLGGFLASLGIVGVGGWFFARQALRPMQRVVQEVDAITASDLHRRLSQADGQDEVSHLAQRFNSLLNRLETAFAGQRTFVRDASHELRTPLAALMGELEVALLQGRTPDEYRRTLRSTLDAARLLSNLTNGLLQIARASDDPSQITLSVVRLDELLLQAHEEMQRRQPTCRIDLAFDEQIQTSEGTSFEVRGNEALLLAAMLNVLENACKFSRSSDKPIVATLTTTTKRVMLEVLDYGLGMNEADRQQVFVPFFRAETVRNVPGHGIGLPLTAKIMSLHCGSVQVESQLNIGTRVKLDWPIASSHKSKSLIY